jgi:hypothetical protein
MIDPYVIRGQGLAPLRFDSIRFDSITIASISISGRNPPQDRVGAADYFHSNTSAFSSEPYVSDAMGLKGSNSTTKPLGSLGKPGTRPLDELSTAAVKYQSGPTCLSKPITSAYAFYFTLIVIVIVEVSQAAESVCCRYP